MIVYGKNVFTQLQNDPDAIQEVYVLKDLKNPSIKEALSKIPSSKIRIVTRNTLDRYSNQGVHQGIAAKVKDIPTFSLEELIEKVPEGQNGFFVALDEVQDPHNVGAILRTADAIGAHGVILTKHNSAGLTPAAVKASTGAAYTMPVAVVTNLSQAIKTLKKNGYWAIGTDFDESSRDYRQGIYDVNLVMVIGNEGSGISPNVKKQCDYKVHLPMKGHVQSLNASVAAGILMYEINRQRDLAMKK